MKIHASFSWPCVMSRTPTVALELWPSAATSTGRASTHPVEVRQSVFEQPRRRVEFSRPAPRCSVDPTRSRQTSRCLRCDASCLHLPDSPRQIQWDKAIHGSHATGAFRKKRVEQEVSSGRYETADQLIAEAIRYFLDERGRSQRRLDALRRIGRAVDEAGLYDRVLVPGHP